MTNTVILGGGWAGVIFALELQRNFPNLDTVILEKYNVPGGLLKSSIINGHVFDVGGSHIIFSRNKNVLEQMLSLLNGNFIKHARKTYVLLNSLFVPYPLENGLYVLPPEERVEALISFLEALTSRDDNWMPKTFKDWVYGFFGKWFAERYLIPYNFKIWKRPLEEIDVDWVYTPGRLPIPDWRDVVKSATGQQTLGYREQSEFYYPKKGGIQRLFDSALEKVIKSGVHYMGGYKIIDVEQANDGWLINKELHAKKLVSSIPLNELVRFMEAPEYVIKLSEQLDYNRVLIVGFAINRYAPVQHWVYVPKQDVVFHRYAWISNYSPFNAPPNKSTLIAEVTISPNQPFNAEKYVAETFNGLEKLGIIESRDVLFTRYWLHEYGYPVHTIKSNKARTEITRWLLEQNITLIGRWGCWQYWNIDKVYREVLSKITYLTGNVSAEGD